MLLKLPVGYCITRDLIGAWLVKHEIMPDRPTDQPTDRPTD